MRFLFLPLALFFGGLGHCTGEWHMLAVRVAPANQDGGEHATVDLGTVMMGRLWGHGLGHVEIAYRIFEVGF